MLIRQQLATPIFKSDFQVPTHSISKATEVGEGEKEKAAGEKTEGVTTARHITNISLRRIREKDRERNVRTAVQQRQLWTTHLYISLVIT